MVAPITSVADQSMSDQSAVDQSMGDQSAANQSAVDQRAVDQRAITPQEKIAPVSEMRARTRLKRRDVKGLDERRRVISTSHRALGADLATTL